MQEALKAQHVRLIDEVRELEDSRLDALQAAVWTDAIAGDPRAVQLVLKIMDQRAKLLGLHTSDKKAAGTLVLAALASLAMSGRCSTSAPCHSFRLEHHLGLIVACRRLPT